MPLGTDSGLLGIDIWAVSLICVEHRINVDNAIINRVKNVGIVLKFVRANSYIKLIILNTMIISLIYEDMLCYTNDFYYF